MICYVLSKGLTLANDRTQMPQWLSWNNLRDITGKDLSFLKTTRLHKTIHLKWNKKLIIYDASFIKDSVYIKNKIRHNCSYINKTGSAILIPINGTLKIIGTDASDGWELEI